MFIVFLFVLLSCLQTLVIVNRVGLIGHGVRGTDEPCTATQRADGIIKARCVSVPLSDSKPFSQLSLLFFSV